MIDAERLMDSLGCRVNGNDMPCFACHYYKHDEDGIGFCDDAQLYKDAVAMLKKQPEVVLCADCVYGIPSMFTDNAIYCGKNKAEHYNAWFCADGERK